jgi:hypothetical protein
MSGMSVRGADMLTNDDVPIRAARAVLHCCDLYVSACNRYSPVRTPLASTAVHDVPL